MSLLQLIDNISVLVDGHSEPADIKPHLSTLHEQAEALESAFDKLQSKVKKKQFETEIATLKTENHTLRTQVDSLQEILREKQGEIERLSTQATEEVDTAINQPYHCDADEQKILLFLAENPNSTAEYIMGHTGFSVEKTHLHLTRMRNKLIGYSGGMYGSTRLWHLIQGGREYLNSIGKLP